MTTVMFLISAVCIIACAPFITAILFFLLIMIAAIVLGLVALITNAFDRDS